MFGKVGILYGMIAVDILVDMPFNTALGRRTNMRAHISDSCYPIPIPGTPLLISPSNQPRRLVLYGRSLLKLSLQLIDNISTLTREHRQTPEELRTVAPHTTRRLAWADRRW